MRNSEEAEKSYTIAQDARTEFGQRREKERERERKRERETDRQTDRETERVYMVIVPV